MKRIRFIISFVSAVVLSASAKKVSDGVYVMGVSISFTDSVAYFTEVQFIDGVTLEKGTKFLPNRQHYAHELEDFMALERNMPGRTSIIYFSKKKNKLMKREAQVKRRLEKRKGLTVRYLGDNFKFTRP